MKKLFYTLLIITIVWGELPPNAYENTNKSPEILMIQVIGLSIDKIGEHDRNVTAKAKVLYVERSMSNLKKEHNITINYITQDRIPKGLNNSSVIPVLKDGRRYKAFLQKDKSGYYKPSLRGKSFR